MDEIKIKFVKLLKPLWQTYHYRQIEVIFGSYQTSNDNCQIKIPWQSDISMFLYTFKVKRSLLSMFSKEVPIFGFKYLKKSCT